VKVLVGFIAGAIVGFGIGIASSIVYSGQTGQDLREVYKDVRRNVESVDLDQFGQEVRANVAQTQADIQTNVAQVQANVADVQAQVGEKVAQVRGKGGENGTEPVDDAAAEAAGI
jgi:gas vesicle protein